MKLASITPFKQFNLYLFLLLRQACLKKQLEFFSECVNFPAVDKGINDRVYAGENTNDKNGGVRWFNVKGG